jgi:hypothetical protein
LVKVLEHCRREKVKDPVVVAAGVCRQWRQILTSVPHLWTKIKFGPCPIEVTSKRLEWSKEELIDVTFPEPGWKHLGNDLLGANPWISRTKFLTIKRDLEHLKKVFGTLHSAAPKLESLIIEGAYHSFDAYSTDSTSRGNFMSSRKFLGRSAPSLQSITFRDVLPGMAFTFPLPMLTKIDWVAPTAYVWFDEILNLLSTSPLLEDITVHAKVRLQDRSDRRRVTLGELHHLDWKDYEGSTSLVPHVIAPKLKGLRIQVIHKDCKQNITLASILYSGPKDIGLFQLKPVAVDYSYGPLRRSWRFRYPDPETNSLWIEAAWEKQDGDEIDWSLSGLPISLSSTKSLTVQPGVDVKNPHLWEILPEELRNLERITLEKEIDLLIPLVGMACHESVPFPHLSELRINLRSSPSVLLTLREIKDVLNDRKRAGYPVNKIQFLVYAIQYHEIANVEGMDETLEEAIWLGDKFI